MKMVLLIIALAGGLAAPAAPILIDHHAVDALATVPDATLARASELNWFFAHASVGENLMDGITDWHTVNPARYPLTQQEYEWPAPAPATTVPGVIYNHMWWNPGWREKLDILTTNVSTYWHAPRANVVLAKWCYIDWTLDVDAYLAGIQALEKAYPTTAFVYMTQATTTEPDRFEVMRANNNQKIRDWAATNNVIFFDVADIESHTPDGQAAVFTYDGLSYPRLSEQYAAPGGGGHLVDTNNVGRDRAALGFYALTVALFTTDRNGDGLSDGDNLLAGTSPTATVVVTPPPPQIVSVVVTETVAINGTGIPGQTYRIDKTRALGTPWVALGSVVAGPSGILFYQDTSPKESESYYRLVVP